MAVVKPDLQSHWKLRSLILKLSQVLPEANAHLRGSLAVTILVRLWLHAESSKVWRFRNMNPQILAGVCEWPYDPAWLWQSLEDCRFIEVKKGVLAIHDWQVYNSSLVAAWARGKYGKLGGRPAKPASLEGKTSKVSGENRSPSMQKPDREDRVEISTPPKPPKGGEGVEPLNAQFEIFWQAYPRKVGKRAALVKWRAFKPDLKKCLAALRDQSASEQWQREGGRFVPHPATWLGQGRWDDSVELSNFAKNDSSGGPVIEPEVPGWRELMLEANPELNLTWRFWGEVPPPGRAWAKELYNAKKQQAI